MASVAAVTWFVENPPLATVIPEEPAYRGTWVTGLNAGPGTLNVRLRFTDGAVQQAAPRAIIVVAPPASPSGVVVAEGAVFLEPPSARSRFIPFDLPEDAARVDITVD